MKTYLSKVFIFLIIIFLAFLYPQNLLAQASPLFLINEVQIGGITGKDEFVELYNQTENPISLTDWVLKRAISSTKYTLATLTGTIPAHGYFLIVGPDYDGSTPFNIKYASSIGNNNTLYLFDNNGLIVDKVGMGVPYESEGSPAPEPLNNSSIERINHQDTNNNLNDFQINNSPTPQNSSSPADPPSSSPQPTPTTSPTPEASPTIEPSVSPTPQPSPSSTPSPTVEPSASPSFEPSPSTNPSFTPIVSPAPSVSPTPSPSSEIIFQGYNIVCTKTYRFFKILWLSFSIPQITCTVKT